MIRLLSQADNARGVLQLDFYMLKESMRNKQDRLPRNILIAGLWQVYKLIVLT